QRAAVYNPSHYFRRLVVGRLHRRADQSVSSLLSKQSTSAERTPRSIRRLCGLAKELAGYYRAGRSTPLLEGEVGGYSSDCRSAFRLCTSAGAKISRDQGSAAYPSRV